MSIHYIFLNCARVDCDQSESIYTGDIHLEHFSDEAFELSSLHILCKEHEGWRDQ